MEEYLQLLQNFGFPVVMVLWFAFRLEKILKGNTEALQSLTLLISSMKAKRKI